MLKTIKPKLVIYTTLLGDKEPLGDPLSEITDFDTDLDISYMCFTDSQSLTSDTWELKLLDLHLLSTDKMCRQAKALPHLFFPEYQYSLWIDNIVKLKRLPRLSDLETKHKYLFKLFLHSGRSSLFEEACAIHGLGYESSETLLNQIEHYSKFINLSSVAPLSTTTVIFREHHHPSVIKFGQTWWSHILNFSKRDQLSFDFVRVLLQTQVDYLEGTKMNNDLVYPQENYSSSRLLANFDERKYSYIHGIPQSEAGKSKELYFNSSPDMQRSNRYARRNSSLSLILNLSHSGMTSRFSPRRNIESFLESKLTSFTNQTTNALVISDSTIPTKTPQYTREEIHYFKKACQIYLSNTFITDTSNLELTDTQGNGSNHICFDMVFIFNLPSQSVFNTLPSVLAKMNSAKASLIYFASETIDLKTITHALSTMDKKIHVSLTGFFNEINGEYIDNSILSFHW